MDRDIDRDRGRDRDSDRDKDRDRGRDRDMDMGRTRATVFAQALLVIHRKPGSLEVWNLRALPSQGKAKVCKKEPT